MSDIDKAYGIADQIQNLLNQLVSTLDDIHAEKRNDDGKIDELEDQISMLEDQIEEAKSGK